MTIQRHFKLALTAGHTIPLVINANQYDSGEQWLFTLYNDGVRYTPSSGAIVGIKADRLGIINTGTVDANGRVVINETRQMTAAVGKNIFELLIDDQTHGTANFMVLVEPRPGDNADLSESDYSLFEEAIQGTSQAAIMVGVQEWMDENLTDPTDPIVDASLSLSGAAADAKKTGDEISALKSAIQQSSGMTEDVKQKLLAMFRITAYINDDAQTAYDALEDALYPPASLVSISAVYTQSGTVYATTSLDDLKADLVVTAHYDNSTTAIVSNYVLSGTLTVGPSTITVAYGGKTTTFTVTVSDTPSVEDGVYTPSEIIRGQYITETGAIETGSDGSCYIPDFIKVDSDVERIVEYSNAPNAEGNVNWRISEYDENHNFIKQTVLSPQTTVARYAVIPTSNQTKYIRLGWYTEATGFVATFTFYTAESLPMEIGDVNATTGEEVEQPKRIRSDYIAVGTSPKAYGCPFASKWENNTTYAWRCFGENHNYLSNVSVLNTISPSVPSGTTYIRAVMQYASSSHVFTEGWSSEVINPVRIGSKYYWLTEAE